MKAINPELSADYYWKDLVYMYERLDANPQTMHLAPVVFTHLEKFDEISRTERETEWSVVQNQARNNAADERVEKHLRKVQSSVLNLVTQNRQDLRYKDLFPADFSTLLRANPGVQKELVERMKKVLKRGDYEDGFRDAQESLLDQVLMEIDKIQERQAALEERKHEQQSAVKQWKDDTNKVRREVYGDLLKFSESSDSAWLNGFFRIVRKAPKLSALEKSKREVARAQKKLDKLTKQHAVATSESEKAAHKAAIEKAKEDLEKRYREMAKNKEKDELNNPPPSQDDGEPKGF